MAVAKINQAGVNLIKSFEGCKLYGYPDPATGGAPITVGYGTTGKGIKLNESITQTQAETWLVEDINKFADGVDKLVKVPLTENQKAALTSFAYNCGLGNLGSSTLLKLVNAKDFKGAQAQFERWNKAAGKVMPGLTRRRAAEAALFGTK